MHNIDLEQYNTNEEIVTAIKFHVSSIPLDSIIKELSKKFIYQDETIRKIYVALATGSNIILHGPGGYGKSELVKEVCNFLGLPLVCKIGYDGMMPEELFGLPDMKELFEKSTYKTAFENSIFSKRGICLIEEGMDMSPQTAAALKDILTEGGWRENGEKKSSLISTLILTGNLDPEDESLNINESTRAFYQERFPIRHKVMWLSHQKPDYLNLFKSHFNKEYREKYTLFESVATLCSNSAERISPRIALKAADISLNLGFSYIDTIAGLDADMIAELKHSIALADNIKSEKLRLYPKIQDYKAILELNNKDISISEIVNLIERCTILKLDVTDLINPKTFTDEVHTDAINLLGDTEFLLGDLMDKLFLKNNA